MSEKLTAVCVFCGSNQGATPAYAEAARAVGRLLAERGIRLVYGGGRAGLMGLVADGVLEAGGTATGVITRKIAAIVPPHAKLSDLHVVDTMHERKALMGELSDAFVVLPGGVGTWEEAFEAVTWTQLHLHDKPAGFLNVNGFYDPTIAQLDRSVAEGFVRQEYRDVIYFDDDPVRLLQTLAAYEAPNVHKWIDRDRTPAS